MAIKWRKAKTNILRQVFDAALSGFEKKLLDLKIISHSLAGNTWACDVATDGTTSLESVSTAVGKGVVSGVPATGPEIEMFNEYDGPFREDERMQTSWIG